MATNFSLIRYNLRSLYFNNITKYYTRQAIQFHPMLTGFFFLILSSLVKHPDPYIIAGIVLPAILYLIKFTFKSSWNPFITENT